MNVYFTVMEIMVLILLIVAGRHAWQRGSHVLWQLVAGMLFGVLLEWATIQQLEAYEYGRSPCLSSLLPVGRPDFRRAL